MASIVDKIKEVIRDVPDFPKEGILFKDITPILADPSLSAKVSNFLYEYWKDQGINGVAGIESRGFIFGMQLAQMLKVPFIPIRKSGKLPYQTVKHSYELEYGSAEIEMHIDALANGHNILIHDDLLATGGTAEAAAQLINKCEGNVRGFSFLIELSFLEGKKKLYSYTDEIHSLVSY